MSIFAQAFSIVLGNEEGLTREAKDPGNWTGGRVGVGLLRGTKYGVSASAYPHVDIAALTIADARVIYQRDYWDKMLSDRLPAHLSVLLFDAAVNCGVSRAVRWLQQAAGTDADGAMGPSTIEAVTAAAGRIGEHAICAEFLASRLMFMTSLPTWRNFGLGWARRLCRIPYEALSIQSQDGIG